MTEIRFERPTPLIPRRGATLKEFATALRHQPGRWALLGQTALPSAGSSRQYAYSISKALPALPGRAFGPGFEAEHRTVLGERRIYVRYIGDSDER